MRRKNYDEHNLILVFSSNHMHDYTSNMCGDNQFYYQRTNKAVQE